MFRVKLRKGKRGRLEKVAEEQNPIRQRGRVSGLHDINAPQRGGDSIAKGKKKSNVWIRSG